MGTGTPGVRGDDDNLPPLAPPCLLPSEEEGDVSGPVSLKGGGGGGGSFGTRGDPNDTKVNPKKKRGKKFPKGTPSVERLEGLYLEPTLQLGWNEKGVCARWMLLAPRLSEGAKGGGKT